MKEIAFMKKQAKKYLDTADEKVVKMVYAMLEVDAQKDWWDDVSDEAKASIERGLKDAEAGRATSHNGTSFLTERVCRNTKNKL